MKRYRLIVVLTAVFLFSSCALFRPSKELEISPAEKGAEVRDILFALQTKNASLHNFKGIGTIKVWQNGIIQVDQRVAWIGEKPLKLSIAVLISGFPAVKLAADGEWLYYLESHGHTTIFKKFAETDPSLKKIISIPITASDVVALLAGRIPLREYNSVALVAQTVGNGTVLVLKQRWWGIRQKIYFNQGSSHVRQIEIFNRSGSLMYRAEIEKIQPVNGYRVPFRLRLSTNAGQDFQLDIDRYWANVDLPPDVFVLTPPD